jgi:uncharacterized phage-associated protein
VIAPTPEGDALFDRVLAFVWRVYGKKPGIELSNLTHTIDGPWDKTRKKTTGLINADIPNDTIREHFARLVTSRNASRPATAASAPA